MVWGFLTVGLLALVHGLVHRLKFVETVPRSRWLSLAGGASVAYVFLHLLPELAAHEATLAEVGEGGPFGALTVWVVALAGLTVFYGLERMIRSLPSKRADGWRVHLASFGLYNLLVGYLVMKRDAAAGELLLFALAMGFHFLTTDYGLRQDHRERWLGWGRWLLVASLLAGAVLGALTTMPEWSVASLFALLAGSVLLNVLKEELPEDRQSRFAPFLAGAAGYGALLLVV